MADEVRLFDLGNTTGRLEIPQDGDEDPVLYLFDPPMQYDQTPVPASCVSIQGLDALRTLLVELGNIPGITTTKE